jgi:hypothetical protein
MSDPRSKTINNGGIPLALMDPRWIAILLCLPLLSGCLKGKDVLEPTFPSEGDLDLKISMTEYRYGHHPDEMDLTVTLKNVCEHPILAHQQFRFGMALIPHAISSEGWEVDLLMEDIDYNPTFLPLDPDRTMVYTCDISYCSYLTKGQAYKLFNWNITDTYTIYVDWWSGDLNHPLTLRSNEITITIR